MALSEESQRLIVILASAICLFGVLAAVALVPPTSTQSCPVLECGPAFFVGDPVGPELCNLSNPPPIGCFSPNDYIYTLSVETSTTEFGQVLFNVTDLNGTTINVYPTGGFTIVNASGQEVAVFTVEAGGQLRVSEESSWTYFTASTGVSAHSFLDDEDTIVIDMGSANPGGRGYWFVPTLTVPGGVASLALP